MSKSCQENQIGKGENPLKGPQKRGTFNPIIAMTPSACHLATQLRQEDVRGPKDSSPLSLGFHLVWFPLLVQPTGIVICLSFCLSWSSVCPSVLTWLCPLLHWPPQCYSAFPCTSAQTCESSYISRTSPRPNLAWFIV